MLEISSVRTRTAVPKRWASNLADKSFSNALRRIKFRLKIFKTKVWEASISQARQYASSIVKSSSKTRERNGWGMGEAWIRCTRLRQYGCGGLSKVWLPRKCPNTELVAIASCTVIFSPSCLMCGSQQKLSFGSPCPLLISLREWTAVRLRWASGQLGILCYLGALRLVLEFVVYLASVILCYINPDDPAPKNSNCSTQPQLIYVFLSIKYHVCHIISTQGLVSDLDAYNAPQLP